MSGIEAAAGSRVYVVANAPATFDAAGYAALTKVLVGLVGSVPEIGDEFELATFKTLAGTTEKDKGGSDSGGITIPIALAVDDAGQIILDTAAAGRGKISFCVLTRSGIAFWNYGLAMSFKTTIGGGGTDVITKNAVMQFTKTWVQVNPA